MLFLLLSLFAVFAEKRPLKVQVPNTYYRNPTTRLLPRDFADVRQHNPHYFKTDGVSNFGSLVGANEVVYTFRPSKQLVSVYLTDFIYIITTS